jgi:hypothetical protein
VVTLKRIVLGRPEPRYFTVDGGTELAYQFGEASVLVDAEGREDLSMEYLLEKKPQMQRMEQVEALASAAPTVKFAPLTFTVEDAVRLLHSKVVKPPAVFSKILTNRFEVTDLDLMQLPVYVFRFKYHIAATYTRSQTLQVNAVTGAVTYGEGKPKI